MAFTLKDIEYAAQLARLTLTDEEKSEYLAQLSSMLGYFESLSELDLTNVEPTMQVTGAVNVWRADAADATIARDELIHNVPVVENGSIKVPNVF